METLEQARRLNVSATSPKLAVIATADGGGNITVRFADNAATGHGEAALATEITAAVRGAFAGYRKGLTRILGSDPMAAEHPRYPRQHPAARLRRRFVEAAEQLSVQCTSPGRVAQMRWRGTDQIEFRLRPGSVAELVVPEPRLTAEVNAVIASTLAERRRVCGQLFKQIHRPVEER